MAINIKTQNLIPVRRDGQTALTLSGGFAASILGTNSSTGGGTWGSISGTLSDQTDLNTALNGKVSTSVFNASVGTLTTRLNTTDTSLFRLDASVRDTVSGLSVFIPEVSLNRSYFKWVGGLLEPSIAGSGGVSQAYVDGSLNRLIARDASFDASLGTIWTKFGNVDTSLLNLGIKNAAQDTSIVGIWAKFSSVDTSLLNLGTRNAAQDTSLNGIWTKLGSVDTSLNLMAVKTHNHDTIYLKEASIGTGYAWLSGKLNVDVSAAAGGVTQTYVDGSLATRDSSISALFSEIIAAEASIGKTVGDVLSQQFGSGIDGDVTISGNSTLTREMYYNNLTVNTGITLNTAGYRIYVKGTLTLTGTGSISCSGGNGVNGSNSPLGGGGTGGVTPYTEQRWSGQSVPSSGGDGGTGGGTGTSNAGASGSGSLLALSLAGTTNFPRQIYTGAGASGGGGHGSAPVAGSATSPTYIYYGVAGKSGGTPSGTASICLGGGGGGAGGGTQEVYCNILSGSGVFKASGGNGGNGMTSSTTYSGNGGGGNGGSVIVFYRTQSSWTGSFNVNGGSAGTGGTGGTAGATGVTRLQLI